MKKLQLCMLFASVMTLSTVFSPIMYAEKVSISDVQSSSCVKTGGSVAPRDDPEKNIKKGDCVGGNSVTNIFGTVVNIILFLVGAVAVIMLVVGGFRYVTSNGDQNAITGAKNTILYAVIGIVVAFMAYAIAGFVIDQLT